MFPDISRAYPCVAFLPVPIPISRKLTLEASTEIELAFSDCIIQSPFMVVKGWSPCLVISIAGSLVIPPP